MLIQISFSVLYCISILLCTESHPLTFKDTEGSLKLGLQQLKSVSFLNIGFKCLQLYNKHLIVEKNKKRSKKTTNPAIFTTLPN